MITETDEKRVTKAYHLTDTGNAQRLIDDHRNVLRYNMKPHNSWLYWNDCYWVFDDTQKIYEYARKTVIKMYKETSEIFNEDKRIAHAKWATKSEARKALNDMILLASTNQDISIESSSLDANPWLLNTKNVTLDLHTGEAIALRHDPKHYITKLMPVEFQPEADCPSWRNFVNEIFHEDEALINYVQRAVGYSLTGDTSEQCLFFCYGTGKNGKSVFFETLKKMFGDYAGKAPSEMLMQQRNVGISNDVASITGKRLVMTSEIEENRRFNESKLKDLTGGDTISARKLYCESFEFTPTHKLWIFGNHKPYIHGDDNGIWRRIKLIPFTYTVPDDKQVPMSQLMQTFRAELSGILNWALQGFMEYMERGLSEPEAVEEAVNSYRSEMDVIGLFIDEMCTISFVEQTLSKDLWAEYREWCNNNGFHHLSSRRFNSKLRERGYDVKPGTNNVSTVYGITIN